MIWNLFQKQNKINFQQKEICYLRMRKHRYLITPVKKLNLVNDSPDCNKWELSELWARLLRLEGYNQILSRIMKVKRAYVEHQLQQYKPLNKLNNIIKNK